MYGNRTHRARQQAKTTPIAVLPILSRTEMQFARRLRRGEFRSPGALSQRIYNPRFVVVLEISTFRVTRNMRSNADDPLIYSRMLASSSSSSCSPQNLPCILSRFNFLPRLYLVSTLCCTARRNISFEICQKLRICHKFITSIKLIPNTF